MTHLRVIVDNLFDTAPTGVTRYTAELARALVRTADADDRVTGVIASHPAESVDRLRTQLPTLTDLAALPATSGQLALAWNLGIPPRMLSDGATHSPTMLAPLFSHNRLLEPGVHTVVTLHSTAFWTAPERLSRRARARFGRMLTLAERHADAVVVSHHGVADLLDERTDLGNRVHIVPVAPTRRLIASEPFEPRLRALGLPERFLLAFASETEAALRLVLSALARSKVTVPLLLVGRQQPGQVPASRLIAEAGLGPDRVQLVGEVEDDVLALLNTAALGLVYFGDDDSLGLPLLDAMAARTPIIYPSTDGLLEITGNAGLSVDVDGRSAVDELVDALRTVTGDEERAARLAQEGVDRARSFDWDDSARTVWDIHRALA